MSATVESPHRSHPGMPPGPFDQAAERAMTALREAVADRRRQGLLLTVDRGFGVEQVP